MTKVLTNKDGRFFSHYENWECWKLGYWSGGDCGYANQDASALLLSDGEAFHAAAAQVVASWPVSAAVHLSDVSVNRRAWVGQTACFVATGNCQECTKKAWATLHKEQQSKANKIADKVIRQWVLENESCRKQSGQLVFQF